MSGSSKEKLETHGEEATDDTEERREVYLRDGRTLSVADHGSEQLVEIRNEAGLLEVRIVLTEKGPILQMDSVRLQLKASEAVEIESKRVEIKGTEAVEVEGGEVTVEGERDVNVEAKGDVRVRGTKIWLN